MTLSLSPVPQVITFDCYGTLVQWRERFRESIGALLFEHGLVEVDPFAVLATFSKHSSRMGKEKPHRGYKQILAEGFAAAFSEFGVEATADELQRIADTICYRSEAGTTPAIEIGFCFVSF